jgi:hypothetical protein
MPAEVGLRLHSNQPVAKSKSPLGERSPVVLSGCQTRGSGKPLTPKRQRHAVA